MSEAVRQGNDRSAVQRHRQVHSQLLSPSRWQSTGSTAIGSPAACAVHQRDRLSERDPQHRGQRRDGSLLGITLRLGVEPESVVLVSG